MRALSWTSNQLEQYESGPKGGVLVYLRCTIFLLLFQEETSLSSEKCGSVLYGANNSRSGRVLCAESKIARFTVVRDGKRY